MSDKTPKFVKFRDLVTGSVSTIPYAELASESLPISVRNETVWVDREQLRVVKPSPYYHPPFTCILHENIVFIERSLREVFPRTFEEWEESFRREVDAERAIGLWVRAAVCLNHFQAQHCPTSAERHEALQVLMVCLNTTDRTAMEPLSLLFLERSVAEELVDAFFGGVQSLDERSSG